MDLQKGDTEELVHPSGETQPENMDTGSFDLFDEGEEESVVATTEQQPSKEEPEVVPEEEANSEPEPAKVPSFRLREEADRARRAEAERDMLKLELQRLQGSQQNVGKPNLNPSSAIDQRLLELKQKVEDGELDAGEASFQAILMEKENVAARTQQEQAIELAYHTFASAIQDESLRKEAMTPNSPFHTEIRQFLNSRPGANQSDPITLIELAFANTVNNRSTNRTRFANETTSQQEAVRKDAVGQAFLGKGHGGTPMADGGYILPDRVQKPDGTTKDTSELMRAFGLTAEQVQKYGRKLNDNPWGKK